MAMKARIDLKQDTLLKAMLAVSVLLCVCVCIYGALVYYPLQQRLQVQQQTLTKVKREYTLNQSIHAQYQQIDALLPVIEKLNTSYQKAFNSTEFAGFIYTAADLHKVHVYDDTYQDLKKQNQALVKLRLNGSYQGIRQFIAAIYALPYTLSVNKMDVRVAKNQTIEARLHIKVYRYQEGSHEN